jgi:hypothetical protein
LTNSKSVFGVHFAERSNHQFALFSAIEGLQDAVLLSWDSLTPSQIVDARTFLLEYAAARLSSSNYQEVFLLVNKAAHAIAVISKRGWVDAVSLEVRWSCAFSKQHAQWCRNVLEQETSTSTEFTRCLLEQLNMLFTSQSMEQVCRSLLLDFCHRILLMLSSLLLALPATLRGSHLWCLSGGARVFLESHGTPDAMGISYHVL